MNARQLKAKQRRITIARVTLALLGFVDIFRGIAHTFAIYWASTNVAKMDPHPDALFVLGAFGNSNFLTAALFILIALNPRTARLSGWVLGLIPAAYTLGTIGLQINGVVARSEFNGRYMMFFYMLTCISVFAYFAVGYWRDKLAVQKTEAPFI